MISDVPREISLRIDFMVISVYHDNQWPFQGIKKLVQKPVPRLTHEICFYNAKVFHVETGEFIGQAKTPATLKKKIQEYYMLHGL